MNIHEYQAKALLSEFGVPISKGVPVLNAADAPIRPARALSGTLAGQAILQIQFTAPSPLGMSGP